MGFSAAEIDTVIFFTTSKINYDNFYEHTAFRTHMQVKFSIFIKKNEKTIGNVIIGSRIKVG